MAKIKPVRMNANQANSKAIRDAQKSYSKKFSGANIPLEAIADKALELGLPLALKEFNI